MKKILISGGTSYIGQMLINSLSPDFLITVLIRNENKFSIINKDSQYKIINLSDKGYVKSLKSEEFDIYINLISSSKKIKSFGDILESINSNIFINYRLLNLLIKSDIKKIIQINSYWQLLKGFDRRKFSIYTLSKELVTRYLRFKTGDKLPTVSYLYLGDVYGSKDFRNKLIPKLLKNNHLTLDNKNRYFYPNYIEDIINFIRNNISSTQQSGHYVLFNETIRIKDIARTIKNLNNKQTYHPKTKSISATLNIGKKIIIQNESKSFSNNIKQCGF